LADAKTKLQIATDVRDSLDKLIGPGEYPKFLARFIPVFKTILEGPAVFNCTHIEHKLRNCILDIIHRLPFQPPDALETYASELMMLLMDLVRRENEDNAVLCMKTIGNFYRNCGKALASQAEATLQLIRDMFEKMPNAVKEAFDDQGAGLLGQPSTVGIRS
jgi:transformation/transcription domain-associated protein